MDGVAPEHYHSTSMFPEYYRINGKWTLAEESRMDSSVVLRPDGCLDVVENRNLRKGDMVILGRTERGEEGIYVHTSGFSDGEAGLDDQFVFRQGRSRETSYARDYDGLLAGNALATHDLEGALLHTALGQDIYSQISQPNGHYNHLDVINKVRRSGSIPDFIRDYGLDDGIICACVRNRIPFVLTGSIRDDGPLPEVIGDAYAGQSAMRSLDHGDLPCHYAPHHRRGEYDALLPGTARRDSTACLSLRGGRGRVRGKQAPGPWKSGRHHHGDQCAGLYPHRSPWPGPERIEKREMTCL